MSDLSISVQGIHQAMQSFDTAASRIAGAGSSSSAVDTVDFSAEILAMLAARTNVEANVNVAHAVDEMQQSILNVLG